MARIEATGDGISIRFEGDEAELLRKLCHEMRTLLRADIEADPVHQRLFPDAYRNDEEGSRAYRALVGRDLAGAKLEALDALEGSLAPRGETADVSTDVAAAWLRVLTDMRLAIGTRMGVTEDLMARDLDPEDDDAPAMMVLHWLGWLQETMLEALRDCEGERPDETGTG